jgi:hypothetical protein
VTSADTTALNLPDKKSDYTPLMWAITMSFGSTALLDQVRMLCVCVC